jgi:cell division protein FtsW (lipid II flippase)
LIILAGVIIGLMALSLTLAPAIRRHSGIEDFQFQHWLGAMVWGTCFVFLNAQTKRHLPGRDPFLLPAVALLTGIGLLTIWRLFPNLGFRQMIWIVLGTGVMFFGIKFPLFLDYLQKYKYIWLVSGLALTGLTILFGLNPNGTGPRLWLQVLGVHFQPSELLKLLLITYLAGYFQSRLSIADRKLERFLPSIVVVGIALLLLVVQRDLGTASIFLLIYLVLLFTTQGDRIILLISPILFLLIAISGYLLIDVVRLRIDTWLTPFTNTVGAGYQINQSMIAIAEGGLLGTGPGLGSPSLVPVSVSDFIYAAIAEELGFFGTTILILCFIFLIYRGTRLALATKKLFHRYLTLGILFYFAIQSTLIIGGNIGLLPLTGVTLPFVSYGGSSLVVSFIALLILLVISHQTQDEDVAFLGSAHRTVWMSGLIIAALVIEIIITSLLSFWFSPTLVDQPANLRWVIDDRFQPRGEILDRNNQVIITNSGEPGNFQRVSNHIPLYPIIGYTNPVYGQTGIESAMYPYLRGLEGYPYSAVFLQNLLHNQPPVGLDIRLTLDLSLQRTADALLDEHLNSETPGTLVLLNANSGEVLAMASHPYFDAANLEADWEKLINDQNAPLVNRATQGMYPAGDILLPFIVSAQADQMENVTDPRGFLPDFDNKIQCPKPLAADVTWQEVFSANCTGIQDELIKRIGSEIAVSAVQSFGFLTPPTLHLPVAEVPLSEDIETSLISSGDAPMTISPLQMALAASALSNNGSLPGARIVNAYQDPNGNWVTLPKLASNTEILGGKTALQTTQLFQNPSDPVWQHAAVVTIDQEVSVSWFIAGTTMDWQGQPIVVAVLVESDDILAANEIGLSLLENAMFNPAP